MKKTLCTILSLFLSFSLLSACVVQPLDTQPSVNTSPDKNFQYDVMYFDPEAYVSKGNPVLTEPYYVEFISSEEDLQELIAEEENQNTRLISFVNDYDCGKFTNGNTTLLAILMEERLPKSELKFTVQKVTVSDGAMEIDLERAGPEFHSALTSIKGYILLLEIQDFAYNGETIEVNVTKVTENP